LIDPFGGVADLKQGLLRHVGESFAEDPVRMLRAARFAARFAGRGFRLAAETLALMRAMVDAGEADHLVPERVWQELSRGLMEAAPSMMFEVLRACGALTRLLPEVDRLFGVAQSAQSHAGIDTGAHVMMALDYAASRKHTLPIRFAVMCNPLGHKESSLQRMQGICDRLRVPADCRDLARMAARWQADAHAARHLPAEQLLALMDATDALRRAERFRDFIEACACDHHCHPGFADVPYPPREFLLAALSTLQALNLGSIAQANPNDITGAIAHAKLEQLRQFIERNTT
jgi:tRNA nucleotidyltransferase (CCA-adding enzyme)